MALKRKPPKGRKKAPPSKATAPKKTANAATKSTKISPVLRSKGAHTVYVDSRFFFPADSSLGYIDHFQEGRQTVTPGTGLVAALPLPVNAVIRSITVYYKNTSREDMQFIILKKSIDHHCPSGEVEVTIDFLPPASLPPDDFVAKYIDHFDAGGLIKDKYLYFIEVYGTGKPSEKDVRLLRGISIDYTYLG
ncbi:hypothetical protein [Paraflavitalea speifideaquila]|uniref:hypothetical protein n=1 Tax=Paraflavitalea speifideaquila TaxID=3076558 RepID=UPI0028E97E19|nr:hypothetical protein [Paraflavitalea speifideiaquila]